MQTPRSDPQPRVNLTKARTGRKWSQQEVAELIGTTHLNVSRWERGITRPGPYFRSKLCALFGKSPQELDLAEPPAPFPPIAEPVYATAIPLQPATRPHDPSNNLAHPNPPPS